MRRRRAAAFWLVSIVALGVWLGTTFRVEASAATREIASVTYDASTNRVTMRFTTGVYSVLAADGSSASGPLVPGDFVIAGGGSATVSGVTHTAGQDSAVIQLSGSPQVNTTTIGIAAGSVFESDGTAYAAQSEPVPLDAASLDGILAALQDLDIPLADEAAAAADDIREVANLPLVGDWFANQVGDAEVPRPLSELVSGLAAIPASAADTQTDLEQALEGLAGISDAAFDAGGLTITFDDAATAATPAMAGRFDLDAAGIAVSGSPSVALSLDGTLRLVAGGATATVDPATPPFQIVLDASATVDVEAHVGFVELVGEGATLAFDGAAVSVDLTCPTAAPCAPSEVGATADVTAGTASFTVQSLELQDGSGNVVFPPAGGAANVLDVAFPDLTDLSVPPTFSAPALGDVANFDNISLDQAVASLQFLAASLAETEQFGALAADLPVAGGQLGDLVRAGQALAERVTGIANLVGSSPSPDTISAQDLVGMLCDAGLVDLAAAECATALDPLRITGDQITYTIDLDVDRVGGTGPEDVAVPTSLGVDIGDALDGFNLSQVAGNLSMSVDASVGLTLGFDIRPDDEIMADFGLSATDFDGDGIANASDTNADGDSDEDAVDPDDDADGLPEDLVLRAGDLCRSAAAILGTTDEALVEANGLTTAPAGWGQQQYSVQDQLARCDDLVAAGATIDTGPGTHVWTATEVCFVGASLFLDADPALADPIAAVNQRFRTLNGYADDPACAAAVAAGTGPFDYDEDGTVLGSPVTIGQRAYIAEVAAPAFRTALSLQGTGLGMTGRIGFLDVALLGAVDIRPAVDVRFVDPATGDDDDRVSFVEIADAVDADQLGDVATLTVAGPLTAHLAVHNGTILPAAGLHLDVVGDFSALDNTGDVFEFHSTALPNATGLTADRIHVGTDLGDFLNFEEIGPAEIRQLIIRFADRMVELAASSALAVDIPFVGSGIQEVLGFADRWATVADQVLAQDPETITGFNVALRDALAANGFPSALSLTIDDTAFLVGFDGSTEIDRRFPFSLDQLTDDLPFPIAPADGGASLDVHAAVDFSPSLGIQLGAGSIEDALFIDDPDLELSVDIDADVFGSVHLGPMTTGLEGHLSVDGSAALDVNTGADDRLTLEELRTGIASGGLLGVTFGGPIVADLTTSNPDGTISISGDLGNLAGIDIATDIDLSSIRLDIDALIEGLIESTRYVGRMLAQSDDLNLELPLIGDGLRGAADLGTRLEALAAQIRALKAATVDDPDAFIAGLNGAIQSALGCTCATLAVLDAQGNPVTSLLQAESVTLVFDFGSDQAPTPTPVDEGIGIEGVFEAGIAFTGQMEYGYGAGFTLGFSRSDGFYLDNGPLGSLFEIYAGLSATDIDGSVDIFGVPLASVVDGSASIGGALGPRGTAGGFTVGLTGPLTLNDIVDRASDIDESFTAGFDIDVAIDLPLETTSQVGPVPLPRLEVPLLFNWSIDGFDVGLPSLSLGSADRQIALDGSSLIGECAGTACTGLIAPVWSTIGQYNPLAKEPLRTILTGEIPVVEQNILELADSLGVADTAFLQLLASLDGTVPSIDPADARIEFGWVEVLPTFAFHENPESWQCQATELIDGMRELFQFLLNIECPPSGAAQALSAAAPAATGSTFEAGPLSVDIPLLDDPSKALGLLLGPDVVDPFPLIEVRFGSGDAPFNIGLGFNFSATLFELNTGFLDGGLSVSFAGGLGLQFRLGIGYDTTGLRAGRSLLDGFYLVDFHNSFGQDVQEISAGGFVSGSIDGHFSVLGGLASVHFTGSAGINLTAGIDFFDESAALDERDRGDGRFHLYEMDKVMEAHDFPLSPHEPDYGVIDTVGFELDDILCIFRPEIDFSAFIQFSGKAKVAGVTVFDDSFSAGGSIIPGGPLSINCPLGIRIAQVIDGQLVLNGGPEYSAQRYDGLGDIAEQFELRREGGYIWVKWLGGGSGYNELRFDPADVPLGVVGDLGAGDDRVVVLNDLGVPMSLTGGPGGDRLQGSNLDDLVDGGDGNDVLAGGGGADTVFGGPGDDELDGGTGNDVLEGGADDDTYRFGDSWGDETLEDPFGSDTLDFSPTTAALTGDASYGEGEIRAGANRLRYFESDIETIKGGQAADQFTFEPTAPSGLRFDGFGGGDTAVVQLSNQNRTLTFHDTGASGTDRLVPTGTAAGDTILLRGQSGPLTAANVEADRGDPATIGFVALLKGNFVDRLDNDLTIEQVQVEGGHGDDTFALDDNVAGERTTINGADGADRFQVGQIFGDAVPVEGGAATTYEACRATQENIDDQPVGAFPRCTGLRDATVGIDLPVDHFGLRDTTRGYLSNGITHPATLNGGDGDDFFQVYSNLATLDMNGNDDDDTFIVRAFALEGSVSAKVINDLNLQVNVDLGPGVDYVEYAQNAQVNIDGGDGFDTLVLVGTEFQDGILVANGEAKICAVTSLIEGTINYDPAAQTDERPCAFSDINFDNVEALGVQALGGNDLVLALSTGVSPSGDLFSTRIFGGENDDVIFFGRNPADATTQVTEHGGDLTGIQGPLTVLGEEDPNFDEAIPPAITLPGESAGAAEPPSPLAVGTDDGDVGIIDATENLTGGNDTGSVDELLQDGAELLNLTGMGMSAGTTIGGVPQPGGIVFDGIDFVDVRLGDGTDTYTVNGTHDIVGDGEVDLPGLFPTSAMDEVAPARVIAEAAGETSVVPLLVQGGTGADAVNVKDIDVATRVLGGDGDDVVSVGSEEPAGPSQLETIRALLEVRGGEPTASDTLFIDDAAEATAQTVTIDQDDVFGLGLHPLGVHYVEIETLDVNLGTADEVANVQGTTAATTVHGNLGNERYYVSHRAALDNATTTDYLDGYLDDVDGDLTLDSGAGRHLLMVSDEETAAGDPAAVITDASISGMAEGLITYTTGGNWADGVTVWASELADGIALNGAHAAGGVRTITTLNAGDGADVIAVDVDTPTHDFAVVNGEEGDDTVDGSASTAGLVVFGGLGTDSLTTGSGNDVVLGDRGRVDYGAGPLFPQTVGGGGPGDRTDGVVYPLFSTITSDGGATPVGGDTINAGSGDDVVLGQQGGDTINGDPGADHLTGGQNAVNRLDDGDTIDGGAGDDRIAGDNARVEPTRDVVLFDVQTTSVGNADHHGADTIHGGDGNDLVLGQGDGDTLHGDGGDDAVEGNHGADTAFGGAGQDDVVGGGSANDGVLDGNRTGTGMRDDGDSLFGDDSMTEVDGVADSHDVVAGDNAWIVGGAQLVPPAGANYTQRRLRTVTLFDTAAGTTSGSDWIRGNGGEDDLYGQFDDGAASTVLNRSCVDGRVIAKVEGDLVCGDGGHDGILGDRGTMVSRTAEALRPQGALRVLTNSPFIDETVYVRGTVVRVVTLDPIAVGGNDAAFGGAGNDTLHTGAGHDLANAGAGDDIVFGADGNDAMWGDVGHDRMYGGFGQDAMDVKPRGAFAGRPADPAIWSVVAPLVDTDNRQSTTNESDTMYGGWDADQLQADEGSAGPRPGDRLVDWQGAYNAYFVCEGAYGAGQAIREFSPDMVVKFQQLAEADGATSVLTEGASGEVELAVVARNEIRHNTNPTHPDHPAHFNCEAPG